MWCANYDQAPAGVWRLCAGSTGGPAAAGQQKTVDVMYICRPQQEFGGCVAVVQEPLLKKAGNDILGRLIFDSRTWENDD